MNDDDEYNDEQEAKDAETFAKVMNLFDDWDAALKKCHKRANKFISLINSGVMKISTKYFPEIKPYKKEILEYLKPAIRPVCIDTLEMLEYIVDSDRDKNHVYPEKGAVVPDRENKKGIEEDRIYQENFLKNTAPPDMHEYYIKNWKIQKKREVFEREFLFSIYDKFLEAIYICFSEILDFTPNQIRWYNFLSYCNARDVRDEFKYFAGDYITDRFVEYEFDRDLRKIIPLEK